MGTDDDVLTLAESIDALQVSIADDNEATRKSTRRFGLILAVLSVLVVGVVVGVAIVWNITQDTNTAVNKTIPDLQEQNADLKKVVDQAVVVITQQLVPQIIELGGEPPLIELNPDKPDD